jgi:hypothetical protein
MDVLFSDLVKQEVAKSKNSAPAGPISCLGYNVVKLKDFIGKLVVLTVDSRSATTVWVDGPMAKVYAKYLGSVKGRGINHHMFLTERNIRFTLTDFEVSRIEIALCKDKIGDHINMYLCPTKKARNSYVDVE